MKVKGYPGPDRNTLKHTLEKNLSFGYPLGLLSSGWIPVCAPFALELPLRGAEPWSELGTKAGSSTY